jgi:GAF domain-containing protein
MTVDPQVLSAGLRRLVTRGQQSGPSNGLLPALQDVVSACVDLFDVTGSGIMLADETNALRYVVASDGQGRLLEIVEAETMQGPCTDAFVYKKPVALTDVREDDRWPDFRAAVIDQPQVRAVLGVPVNLGGVPVGTIDVFLEEPHVWTDAEAEALARYSTVVQTTLTSALAAHTAGEQAAQLQYALDYRIVIERAVGYLMAADRVDAVAAFNRLRGRPGAARHRAAS